MKESLMQEKQRLRESLSDFRTWTSKVKLSGFFDFYTKSTNKKYLGLYKPLKDEILIENLPLFIGWKMAWPIIDEKKGLMSFATADGFNVSSLGFEEPAGRNFKEVFLEELDVIFVPGLAFDYKGARLGRGKGFYDRYLSSFKGVKVGVCHWTRFLNKPIPVDYGHDIFMDYILTDKQLFKVNTAHT